MFKFWGVVTVFALSVCGYAAESSTANPTYSHRVEFNRSGTFTIPSGVTSIYATLGAGGGGGGSSCVSGRRAGSGGAGGDAWGPLTVKPGEVLTIDVGMGGAGGCFGMGGYGGGGSGIADGTTWLMSADGAEGGEGVHGVDGHGGCGLCGGAGANGYVTIQY